jgi:hypothetical protein
MLVAEPYPIPVSEWEYALFFASCGLLLSMVVIPVAALFFPSILTYSLSKRLWLTGLTMLITQALCSVLIGFALSHLFDTRGSMVVPTLLFTTPYLISTFLSAVLVYRRWIFRLEYGTSAAPNDAA